MLFQTRRFLQCDRGTQLVEFALILPFLILLFASVVEIGRMFYTYTTLVKATEVGARYLSSTAAPSGSYSSATAATAKNLVVCGFDPCTGQTSVVSSLTSTNVTITNPGASTGTGTRYVTVSVSYTYSPLIFNLATLTGRGSLSLNYTFTPSIKMRYMLVT